MNGEGNLAVRYGGRWAPLYSALQSDRVRNSATFCPRADILVQEVKEFTDFPIESVASTSRFS